MIWEKEAEDAVKKVPFFVRKKVRSRVENYVADKGGDRVTLAHVQALKKSSSPKGGWKMKLKGMMSPPVSAPTAAPTQWRLRRLSWSQIFRI